MPTREASRDRRSLPSSPRLRSSAKGTALTMLMMSTMMVASLALAACDGAAAGTSTPDSGGANTSQRMFEARTAAERGDEATAVDIYAELCGSGHTEACEKLMERAESDADLKQRLCFELRYSKAC